MPTYNRSEILKQSVNHVLESTYTDYELIIINDGSTDDTASVCEVLSSIDSRIRVFNISNGGVSNARNVGIKNAHGE